MAQICLSTGHDLINLGICVIFFTELEMFLLVLLYVVLFV